MPPSDQQVDHVDEARGVLAWAVGDKGPEVLGDGDPRGPLALQLAQAHASIAIAEALQGIEKRLSGVVGDEPSGSHLTPNEYVRVRSA